jgi:hypothetical protein
LVQKLQIEYPVLQGPKCVPIFGVVFGGDDQLETDPNNDAGNKEKSVAPVVHEQGLQEILKCIQVQGVKLEVAPVKRHSGNNPEKVGKNKDNSLKLETIPR